MFHLRHTLPCPTPCCSRSCGYLGPRFSLPSPCHPERKEAFLFLRPFRAFSLIFPCAPSIPFRIRTSEKYAPNPFRIRTYKTRYLKSFRICTYKKRPGEGALHPAFPGHPEPRRERPKEAQGPRLSCYQAKDFQLNFRGEQRHLPSNAGLPRANSRYTNVSMLSTTVLDTHWMGRPRSIAAVLLESDGHRAIIDPGPASTLPTLRQHLDSRGIGVSDLNAILLTHIHLDHAGATGALIKENPNLEVYVHKAGMMHLADPAKLLASAERLWPGELQHLFGETLPVPFGNLRILNGGETLALGSRNLDVVFTPGHASHHVSYFDSSDSTAFVGDAAGFHIEGAPYVVPLAPPPDIDLEIWNASLDAIAARRPARLFLTHFGYSNDPAAHIAEYRGSLRRWGALAAKILRSASDERAALETFVAAATAEIRKHVHGAEAEHYLFNCGLNPSWLGLARYHRKRAEAAAASPPRV